MHSWAACKASGDGAENDVLPSAYTRSSFTVGKLASHCCFHARHAISCWGVLAILAQPANVTASATARARGRILLLAPSLLRHPATLEPSMPTLNRMNTAYTRPLLS